MGGGSGEGGDDGTWGMGGIVEHESIKSIQLRHELQGSLSMSKPMKMTIHQERVQWQRGNSRAGTRTCRILNNKGENAHPCLLKVERKQIAHIISLV